MCLSSDYPSLVESRLQGLLEFKRLQTSKSKESKESKEKNKYLSRRKRVSEAIVEHTIKNLAMEFCKAYP